MPPTSAGVATVPSIVHLFGLDLLKGETVEHRAGTITTAIVP